MFDMVSTRFLKWTGLLAALTWLLIGFFGCLEKEEYFPEVQPGKNIPKSAFGLFKVHLTLIDAETSEPLPDLRVKLSNETSSQMNDTKGNDQVTDIHGFVCVTIAAAPPIPQEFVLSFADTTNSRSFQTGSMSVYFFNPVFKYIPDDAGFWGKLYQGTAVLTLSRELKQKHDE
jgi:hypothetical protein